jgi:hypothetical protein
MIISAFICGCNSESSKNLLQKNWILIGLAGPGANKIPDSVKQAIFGNRFMEFTENGEMIATGGRSLMQRGDYKLSADGKTIYTVVRHAPSDTLIIDKLTKDSLVMTFRRDTMQWIMVPKQ